MRVLVYGGRDFGKTKSERGTFMAVMELIHSVTPISVVIEGEAPGADDLAKRWAGWKGVSVEPYPARWDELGHRAGPERNQRMIDQGRPDLAVQMPGGTGTADMAKRVLAAGIDRVLVGGERNR